MSRWYQHASEESKGGKELVVVGGSLDEARLLRLSKAKAVVVSGVMNAWKAYKGRSPLLLPPLPLPPQYPKH